MTKTYKLLPLFTKYVLRKVFGAVEFCKTFLAEGRAKIDICGGPKSLTWENKKKRQRIYTVASLIVMQNEDLA